MSEKILAQIKKLDTACLNLSAKIDTNVIRMRTLVGKLVGVHPGDVVVWKGDRYQVTAILSHLLPSKGLPVLSGLKLLKNGKTAKRQVEIKGAWKPEAPAAKISVKATGKTVRISARRSGKDVRKVLKAGARAVAKPPRVSKRAALAAVAPEGTA